MAVKFKEKTGDNFWDVMRFLEAQERPMSVPEMLRAGLKIPRTTLYDTIDVILDGDVASTGELGPPAKLIELIKYEYGPTSFRFRITEAGKSYIKNNKSKYAF